MGSLLTMLPGETPDRRISVAIVRGGDGSSRFLLNEEHYADGIGWYGQRAMELDATQLRALQNLLKRREIPEAEEGERDEVATIPFNSAVPRRPLRRAVGE